MPAILPRRATAAAGRGRRDQYDAGIDQEQAMSDGASQHESPRRAPRLGTDATMVSVDVPARVVVKVLAITAILYGMMSVIVSLAPFFVSLTVAAFLAIAADPAVRMAQRRLGVGRSGAVGIVMSLVLLAIIGAAFTFARPFITQADDLRANAGQIVQNTQDSRIFEHLDGRYHLVDRAADALRTLPERASRSVGSVLGAVAATLASTLTIMFMMVLLLLGGGQLVQGTARVFPALAERRWWSVVQGAYRAISAYVASTLLIAVIAGLTITVALLVLGVPYAAPLGLWMGLLDIIPLIGATIGAIPAVVVAFATQGTTDGIIMLVIVLLYQQVENNWLQPTIQGRIVSLSALTVFLSVLVGSQLMGILGALLAVPVAGIGRILYDQYVESIGGQHVHLPAIAPDDTPAPPDVDEG